MSELDRHIDMDLFFQSVCTAPQRALLLEFEGTLAPLRSSREPGILNPGVREMLNAILEAPRSRLVLISRCPADHLIDLLALNPYPEIWGSYGWERLTPDGRHTIVPYGSPQARGLAAAHIWLEQRGLTHLASSIPAGIELRWDGLTPRAIEALRLDIQSVFEPLAQVSELTMHELDDGVELRAAAYGARHIIRNVLADVGAGTVAAYLGNIIANEDTFQTIKSYGIGVLVRDTFRPTAADMWLRSSDEVLSFLSDWHQALSSASTAHTPS